MKLEQNDYYKLHPLNTAIVLIRKIIHLNFPVFLTLKSNRLTYFLSLETFHKGPTKISDGKVSRRAELLINRGSIDFNDSANSSDSQGWAFTECTFVLDERTIYAEWAAPGGISYEIFWLQRTKNYIKIHRKINHYF